MHGRYQLPCSVTAYCKLVSPELRERWRVFAKRIHFQVNQLTLRRQLQCTFRAGAKDCMVVALKRAFKEQKLAALTPTWIPRTQLGRTF